LTIEPAVWLKIPHPTAESTTWPKETFDQRTILSDNRTVKGFSLDPAQACFVMAFVAWQAKKRGSIRDLSIATSLRSSR
jgi:hypothetical protein